MSAKFKKNRRDPGRFILVPTAVLESGLYKSLGFSARSLLWDIASQYMGRNNGQLLAGWTFMQGRGWRSNRTLIDAKRELLASGALVVETRMGKFPSTSAWFACTWWPLDECDGMELAARDFPRGQYRQDTPTKNTELGAVSAPLPASTGAVSAQGV